MTLHVMPSNDLKPHLTVEACWCNPEIDDEGDEVIVIHNSMDGRESFETGERKVS